MKYSIMCSLNGIEQDSADYNAVMDTANSYNPLYRLEPSVSVDENNVSVMSLTVWLGDVTEKDGCFAEMKNYVDQHTGNVTWHECHHDETPPKPCTIAEEYKR